ncbi:MAG: sugar phosphate nucleotidyltransferase, partial [Thermoplasmata archaeon]
FFSSIVFEHIKKLKPSWRNEYEITEAIQSIIDSGGKVGYDIIDSWWKDTGTVEDILSANRLILDKIINNEETRNIQGKIKIGRNVKISEDSIVRGPVVIGDNCIIEDNVFIGPYTSIGDNCVLKKVSIENSIIIKNSHIDTEKMIIDSIIGEGSVISNANGMKPSGLRMVIGENSKLYV